VYAASTYVKSKGIGVVMQSVTPANIIIDIPFFYSLNTTFNQFSDLNGIIQIGINLRYEASLLNTLLRREQSRRLLSYITVGSYTSLRYIHSHEGNSLRTLFSSVENRIPFIIHHYNKKLPTALLIGVLSMRSKHANFMQQIVRQLGKLFFVKNKHNDRLGFIHSSIGSLAFAHLGLYTKSIVNLSNENTVTTFSINQSDYNQESLRGFNIIYKTIPVKTLYESKGHLLALQGQIRTHSKVINELNQMTSFNFENALINF